MNIEFIVNLFIRQREDEDREERKRKRKTAIKKEPTR